MPKAVRRLPLHVLITLLFGSLLLLSGFVLGVFHYRQASQIIYDSSAQLSAQIQEAVEKDLQSTFTPIRRLLQLLAQAPSTLGRDLDQRVPLLRPFSQALRDNPQLDSLYVGYPDGDFFMVRPLRDARLKKLLDAPQEARFQVWSIERNGRRTVAQHRFYDDTLDVISRVAMPTEPYDPRDRNWFVAAQESARIITTEPYVFYSSRQVGTTLALALHNGAVLAADLTLADLAATLARHNVTPDTQLVLYDSQGRAVAYPGSSLVIDHPSDQLIPARRLSPGLAALFDMPTLLQGRLRLAGRDWLVSRTRIAEGGPQGLNLAILVPEDQLLDVAYRIRWQSALITIGVTLLGMLLAWLASRLLVLPLRSLARNAEAISRFDFSQTVDNHSPLLEIDQLARVMRHMRTNLASFLEINASLAAETRYEDLLERVLRETLGIGGADAGLLYLRDTDSGRLEPHGWLLRQSHDAPVRGGLLTYKNSASAPVWLRQPAEGGESLVIALGYEQAGDLRELMERLDCRQLQLLCVGLHNRQGDTLGVLLLLNRITGADGDPSLLQPARIAFVEAISGAAALSIETQRLLDHQKRLLEAFIQVIAGAIDAKSPYTGGHCQRVPELTLMLARAAAASHEPPFAKYRPTDEDWEALHIAAWLHDCGKVTTPEYVVDKSTKLETLYNRIHEIRTRFEVLKRDAWVDYWRALAEGGDATRLAEHRDRQLAELDDDFAFVARCNQGAESMAEEHLHRLQRIARRRWQRTLDDRLGLAWEEAQRKAREPADFLPVEESLLADRPDHLIERPESERIDPDNPWGFQIRVPDYKFNLGELYSLSVRHGTLTEEERYLIKHHIVQTLIMLDHLPFPPHLKNVPDIAGSHHERMDGNGYPRRLTAKQLSLPARMMAIADIFEALTAVDRPYKRGKTLSESLMLMANMCRNGHIDRDLFRLFVNSDLPRQYGERFLAAEQIDTVDEQAVLARAGCAT
ncbi:MAG TPA: HD domain-containing phosphohydrolase [Pseudomonas sp.]|nr:HD domain-containing phosphohydrolase [Pseudomonas sp.]